MRISYEQSYKKLALALEEYGHELFPSDELHECDAVLCSSFDNKVKAGDKGALYIFAEGKSAGQINDMIVSRLYDKLF